MQENRLSRPLVFIIFADMSLLGFLNSMRGVSFPLIKNSFDVSYNNMGLMGALTSFSAVCFCIVSGNFMNRFGLKKTIVSGFFFVVLGAGSLYFASAFWITVCFFLILQAGFGFFEIGLNGAGVRFFTVKSALMMNLLHFFYGVGAIGGPRFMGFMVNRMDLRWQDVYPLGLVPALILLALTITIRFAGREPRRPAAGTAPEGPSFWSMLKIPMVWLFGIIIGLSGGLEGISVAWSGLYLQDVYGLDPSVTGAAFLSVFYVLYTLSRFLSGFVIEKIGYMRSTIVSCLAIIILFVSAFVLGRTGIYALPVVGFFIAILWPTVLAISGGVFKENAQTASSAMISIAFTLSGIIQYGVGLTNRYLGAAWGYRSSLLYGTILMLLLILLRQRIKVTRKNT